MKFRIVIKTITLLCALALADSTFAQQENLNKGWAAFNANNRAEAIKYFQQATGDPATNAPAYLDLSLVSQSNYNSDDAFKNFLQFYKTATNPYPYIYALWSSEFLGSSDTKPSLDKAHADFFEQLSKDPKAGNTLRTMAYSVLSANYYSINNDAKGKEYNSHVNVLDQWSVVGSFDNISGSGFNKDFDVLAHPQSDYVFKNAKGCDVKWFVPNDLRNDKWYDLTYSFYPDNSIIYAQTFVNSDVEQSVNMLSGVSGSLKIWVNDEQMISEPEERNTDMDVYNCTIKLHKGYNRILLQIGSSDISNSNFMIRLTGADENNIGNNVSCTASYQPYTKETDYKPVSIPLFAEAYFTNELKKDNNSFENRFMLAETYLRNEKFDDARAVLENIRSQAPVSSYVTADLIKLFQGNGNTTKLTTEQEFLKQHDSLNYQSILLNISDAVQKENYNEAKRYLQQFINIYGSSASTDIIQMSIDAKNKDENAAIKDVDDGYTKYPDLYYFVYAKYSLESEQSKDLKTVDNILEKYLQNYQNIDFSQTLINNYFKLGEKDKAEKMMQSIIAGNPYATGFYNYFSQIYYEMRDYNTALKWLQKTLTQAPYNSAYYKSLGGIYEALNDKQNALNAYNTCLYYDPMDYDTRKKLRELQNRSDIFDSISQINTDDVYAHAPDAAAFPNDNSIILLKEKQKVVYDKGASEEKVTMVVKIFTQAGIDDWKETNLDYNSYTEDLVIEKAEVLKKNGTKVKAEINDNDIVFTSLEPGDGLTYIYRKKKYNKGSLATQDWDDFYFNNYVPVQTARYILVMPSAQSINSKTLNIADVQPEIKSSNGQKIYTWQLNNMPAIQPEKYMPVLADAAQRLQISSVPDWNYIADWYSDLSSNKAKINYDVRVLIDSLFHDKTNISELEKAKIIYGFIVKNINYSDVSFLHSAYTPQSASRTLDTRLGDCKDLSTLFVAMAKAIGLKAGLVLVDTRDNGSNDLLLPNNAFNHCIATVEADGKKYLVELTNSYMPFGALSAYTRNAAGLYIPALNAAANNENTLVKLSSPTDIEETVIKKDFITVKGNDLQIKRHAAFSGSLASYVRYTYANEGKTDQYKSMLSTITSDFKNDINIDSLSFGNLNNLADSVMYDVAFTAKDVVTDIAGMSVIRLPWTDAFGSMGFITQSNRITPFEIWQMNLGKDLKETITLQLPDGEKLAETPQDISYSYNGLTYKLTYKITSKTFVVTREMTIGTDAIDAKDYNGLKDFFSNISLADSKQYAFKKP